MKHIRGRTGLWLVGYLAAVATAGAWAHEPAPHTPGADPPTNPTANTARQTDPASGAAATPTDEPAPTAGDGVDTAVLRFEIRHDGGPLIPGRLTFVGKDGPGAKLFTNPDAKPSDLAVRYNVVNTLSGQAVITIPVGAYTIYASRGLEWSIDSTKLTFEKGKTYTYIANLRHEVDTTGWISGDFHLHTLTFSGHGDANLPERIITLIAEGLEFAVATDHNHNTDYKPTIRDLHADAHVTAVTGNEVSTPIGHFNAFPLDPKRAVPNHKLTDARELFKLIRQETNEFGTTPVIQVNHPRWGGIDYFGHAGLDPVTGTSDDSSFSGDFDSIEIFNENSGWGYYDADMPEGMSTGSGRHWVLRDWFNLLDHGHRYSAVGNSDSHTVYSALAAYPRNFVRSATDEPDQIDPADVADGIRKHQVFTTLGPFVEYTVNDVPMGGDLSVPDGRIEFHIKIQAASWIDCDRIKIVVNGRTVAVMPVRDTREVQRFNGRYSLRLRGDSWVTVLVEGDDPLSPIVPDQGRPIRPNAVMNPVWVDANGDGKWISPYRQADDWVAKNWRDPRIRPGYLLAKPERKALILQAVGQQRPVFATEIIRRGLADGNRRVHLSAARAAEQIGDWGLAANLDRTMVDINNDPYQYVAMLRALAACDQSAFNARLYTFLDEYSPSVVRKYGDELVTMLPGRFVRDWQVLAYFPNPNARTLVEVDYGPEKQRTQETFIGKNDQPVRWHTMEAKPSGFLDLTRAGDDPALAINAIAYARTFLYSPDNRRAYFAVGTDDGCRVYLRGDLVYEDATRHGATPWQHFGKLALREGYNEILIKVENGGGASGLFFRVLDDDVTATSQRP